MGLKGFKIRRLIKKLKSFYQNREQNQPSEELIAKEIGYYHDLAKLYSSLIGHKSFPFAAEQNLACLKAAAALDDKIAQYALGEKLLETAKFREKLQQEKIFASPSNEKQMQQLYAEAHAYLQAAENLGHIQAKRLRGLCYINGWGIEPSQEQGFDLIVASIEAEDSWDKIPQIFAAMGLNKPEFFSALIKHRNKK